MIVVQNHRDTSCDKYTPAKVRVTASGIFVAFSEKEKGICAVVDFSHLNVCIKVRG